MGVKVMQPHRMKIGGGLILISLDGLAQDWQVTERAVERVLGVLRVPTITMPDHPKRYVNLYALEYSLFEIGLPEAMRGSKEMATMHHELASVVYGTLTKEVIRERCKTLAKTMRTGLTQARKKPTIRNRRRS